MFEWTLLDHVPLSDSYSAPAHSLERVAVRLLPPQLDRRSSPTATLLISARNTWAVYDIDPRPAQIDWQLGGKRVELHDGARRTRRPGSTTRSSLDGDTFSVFDNGASPAGPPQSRGVVVRARPAEPTPSSAAAQLVHPGAPLLADSQGDLQALPDGDWFVGWGQEPDVSEFSADRRAALRRAPPAAARVLPRPPLPLERRADRPAGARARRAARTAQRASTRAGTARRTSPPGACCPGRARAASQRSRRRRTVALRRRSPCRQERSAHSSRCRR